MRNLLMAVTLLILPACSDGLVGDPPEGGDDDDTSANPVNDPGEQPGDPEQPESVNGPSITIDLTETDEDFMNPERGYYASVDLRDVTDAAQVRAQGYSIALAQVRLDDYRNAPIPSSLLAQLDAGFDSVRAAGMKVVLRFKYNSSETDDAPKSVILGHIAQLKPLLQEHADVIAVMQAGFIGAWGEWHSSTNGLDNDTDRHDILAAILDALPASRNVQVRSPKKKEGAIPGGSLSPSEAYDGSDRSRVGHHNDCFLASATDYGTYSSPIEYWMQYVADDSRYTAMGGETCAVYPARTDCPVALAVMAAHHWSYLNSDYNVNVLNVWDDQGCGDEVSRRLGYRFIARRVTHTETVAPGGVLDVELEIDNVGFASPYNRKPVEIVLTNGDVRHVARLTDVDARRWAAGTTTTLTVQLRVPANVAAGTYDLALRLPDETPALASDPRYAIRLANEGAWRSETGDNVMSTAVVIDPAAPGPRDPTSMFFTQM